MDIHDAYTALARQALETYLSTGQADADARLKSMDIFREKGGCFVSLYKNGELRGCMGTVEPTQESLGQEIMHNSVRAAVHDARFLPVTEEEMPEIKFAVDIILQPEIIYAAEGYNVKEYGIIVMKNGRTGLLLPNLDGINTPDEQLRIALNKAGINRWEKFVMMRFRSEHYEEKYNNQ